MKFFRRTTLFFLLLCSTSLQAKELDSSRPSGDIKVDDSGGSQVDDNNKMPPIEWHKPIENSYNRDALPLKPSSAQLDRYLHRGIRSAMNYDISHHPLKYFKKWATIDDPYEFNYRQIIVPTTLILAGTSTFFNSNMAGFDLSSQQSVGTDHPRHDFDNYLQYSPVALAFGLDLLGVESRHKIKEQTTILAISTLAMGAMVNVPKYTVDRLRPDQSDTRSFPSGHTAMAFMGAEFLRMEFKDVSPWIGVAGYAIASTTAYMRIYNNKHWVTDTLAGAGIGILSVKAAYWLAPSVNRVLWGSDLRKNRNFYSSITPYSNGEQNGVSFSLRF